MEFKALNELKSTLAEYSTLFEAVSHEYTERNAEAAAQYEQEIAEGNAERPAWEKLYRLQCAANEKYQNTTLEISFKFHDKLNDIEREIVETYAASQTAIPSDLSAGIRNLYAVSVPLFRSTEAEENDIENAVINAIDSIEELLQQLLPHLFP